ncbi:prepilin-type N-terminal cleavage/methylation domain-containing protein [Dryocola clanedunensis]|uniref:prepilin-type N-terminal cleavage/methylation domain-containing protein n=1 Tax=Cedecea sulfonylureivorans TaxID=3051154 RepID=UPI0019297D47|nr:prepilin-type N-terminal cleavage/methylation domain-containing protein [Cedecea sulfonylureivorans]
MSATRVRRYENGFSLPEVLCALALFAVIMTVLLSYNRVLLQGFQSQWQMHQLWRLAVELSEPGAPEPPAEWKVIRQQTTAAGCVSIAVNITSPSGRSGQLSQLHCP